MKLNLYSFLFCCFHGFVDTKVADKTRISFGFQALLATALIIYIVILGIQIKVYYGWPLDFGGNKFIIGIGFTIIYFSIGYFLLDRKERYKKLLDIYTTISRFEKGVHAFTLCVILLIPILLKLLNHSG